MARQKSVLTTGEIAKICSVAPRTVSKWFDSGQLRGYRIPGSRDRRVPIEQLVRFMRAHNIPLNGLDGGLTRVLVASSDASLASAIRETLAGDETFEVRTAGNVLEAALLTAWFRPQYLFVDLDLPGFRPEDLFRAIRDHAELSVRHAIAITGAGSDGDRHRLREMGFADCLVKPFDATRIVSIIQNAPVTAR
jgi:excisionase family DNA binding protein